ncbi:MAG: protein translocase subunit SecF, partial [Candidatus Nanoarchaeia archaeon]
QTTLEEFLGYKLDSSNSSIEISGSALAKSFYNQLLTAIVIAFICMAIVVFIIFKTLIPSLMVVFCATLDIIGALALVNLFGFRISTAGIAAFLMLIGYRNFKL